MLILTREGAIKTRCLWLFVSEGLLKKPMDSFQQGCINKGWTTMTGAVDKGQFCLDPL